MALARPVNASLYSLLFMTDQLRSRHASASLRNWLSCSTPFELSVPGAPGILLLLSPGIEVCGLQPSPKITPPSDRLGAALFKKEEEYTILDQMKGAGLVGKKYQPLFPYFQQLKSTQLNQGAFRVLR